jgi:hypothetical protein
LRAARANRVFWTDEKHIRPENTVLVNTKYGLGFYKRSPIACGCAFHPRAIGDPRGRAAVRASYIATARSILRRLPISASGHCALARANRVFCTDEKRIRTENTVLVNAKHGAGAVIEDRRLRADEDYRPR